jgi:acylphosphatase
MSLHNFDISCALEHSSKEADVAIMSIAAWITILRCKYLNFSKKMSIMAEQLHVIVRGRVQGVSFRHYTRIRALELALVGWVRNMPDGTVEVTAEGEREPLEQFLAFLHRGPSGAYVVNIVIEWRAASGEFTDFEVTGY